MTTLKELIESSDPKMAHTAFGVAELSADLVMYCGVPEEKAIDEAIKLMLSLTKKYRRRR